MLLLQTASINESCELTVAQYEQTWHSELKEVRFKIKTLDHDESGAFAPLTLGDYVDLRLQLLHKSQITNRGAAGL